MTRNKTSHHHGLPAEQVSITTSYPFELHYVKALSLARQYKECIRRCEEALSEGGDEMEAAHKIFLHFYTALSHESLARLMHVYSVSRLPECDAAEFAYLKAWDISENKAHFPEAKYYSPHHDAQRVPIQHECKKSDTRDTPVTEDIPRDTFRDFDDDGEERAKRISFSWPETSTWTEDKKKGKSRSLASRCLEYEATENHKAHPNPSPPLSASPYSNDPLETPSKLSRSSSQAEVTELSTYHSCISKAASSYIYGKCGTYLFASQDLQGPSEIPDHPITRSKPYISPDHPPETPIYNSHLTALSLQLQTHLMHIRTLQHETRIAQSQRVQRRTQSLLSVPTTNPKATLPQSRSFWSFKDPVAEMQEKNERIEDGRARGWVFERFKEERYVRLAEEALAELGVKSCDMDPWR